MRGAFRGRAESAPGAYNSRGVVSRLAGGFGFLRSRARETGGGEEVDLRFMQYSFSLDPEEILGVSSNATLEQLQQAYRQKAKKFHPDISGEPWSFRVVQKAYQLLTTSRIARRVEEEQKRSAPPAPPTAATTTSRPTSPPPEAQDEQVRSVAHDEVKDPALLVDVDLFLLRYEVDDPAEFLMLSPEERNLSCSLNVLWPSRRGGRPYEGPAEPDPYIKTLRNVLAGLVKQTRPLDQRMTVGEDRLVGWMSYASMARASEAAKILRGLLREAGYGVDQRSRELVVPRESS